MPLRLLVATLAICAFLTVAARADEVPASCPVTKPSEHPFVPPAPYPSYKNTWIGTSKLWTFVPGDGIWDGVRQKLFWWHEGYDWRVENPPQLTLTAERIDAPASHIKAPHANAGWTNDKEHAFIVDGFDLPTVGCWKITGEYKGERLSYIVWVHE
jgi:hypothetical protein